VTTIKLRKADPVRLRDVGLNEVWLQDQIVKDPSLLGLGDVHLIQRERIQPSGGRIDLLMYDHEAETRYEIEIMLGATNESHIIRTIEYWDIERQRYPTLDHRAVIVAEDITSRFFNIVRLLNRAVPLLAIRLSAFQIDDSIVLHFTRVLDTYEFGAEPEEEPGEQADRGYWERTASSESLGAFDAFVALLKETHTGPRVTYNRYHIAVGTSGYNFAWGHPRRASSHCLIEIKVPVDQRQGLIEKLEHAGIEAANQGRSSVRFRLGRSDLAKHHDVIQEVVRTAEEWSHR
jgi:hypothetical protein